MPHRGTICLSGLLFIKFLNREVKFSCYSFSTPRPRIWILVQPPRVCFHRPIEVQCAHSDNVDAVHCLTKLHSLEWAYLSISAATSAGMACVTFTVNPSNFLNLNNRYTCFLQAPQHFDISKLRRPTVRSLPAGHSPDILIHIANQIYGQKRSFSLVSYGLIFHCNTLPQLVIRLKVCGDVSGTLLVILLGI